ncbi:MAG: glycoside hydrolase family 99-like domain-containing protein [Phycisphaerae bacterium]|nr:glycoside hydrolase family 99-like domain-containing protein [Phycisphaerae bacterium]
MGTGKKISLELAPEPEPVRGEFEVGSYLFPGWCVRDRWERVLSCPTVATPVLGNYPIGMPAIADWQIKWAVEHAITFFCVDWYYADGAVRLNLGLEGGFLRSRFIDYIKFCVMWCNHQTWDRQNLLDAVEYAAQRYFGHPSYLKIDDRPVYVIIAGYHLAEKQGVGAAKKAISEVRKICTDKGHLDPYLVCGNDGMFRREEEDTLSAAAEERFEIVHELGFDAINGHNYTYMLPYVRPREPGNLISYTRHMEMYEKIWQWHRDKGRIPYWPVTMVGQDERPWHGENGVIFKEDRTPEAFAKTCERIKKYVADDKFLMLYCWNEWGEGAFLEPTEEEGFTYLDVLRKVFAPDAGPHTDVRPSEPIALDDWSRA